MLQKIDFRSCYNHQDLKHKFPREVHDRYSNTNSKLFELISLVKIDRNFFPSNRLKTLKENFVCRLKTIKISL